MARITPTLTLMVRSLGPIRPNLHLLRGLTSFSNRLMGQMRDRSFANGQRCSSIVKFSELAGNYPHLKRALASKGIKEVNFTFRNKNFMPKEPIVTELIKKSIRIIMRELDTHGRPTEESTALIYDHSDREQVFESEIVLSAKSSNEINASIKLRSMINRLHGKSNGSF